MANSIKAVFQSWVRSSAWPTLLASLDDLLEQLQIDPPPIDYQRRREIGQDMNLLDSALDATNGTHTSPLPHLQLRRVFWETFTGGDIAYAPEPLTVDPKGHEHGQFRPRRPRKMAIGTYAASIIIGTPPSRRTWPGFSPF